MEQTYNIVELFSGIGSQAKALKNLGIKLNKTYTCEWDIHAFVAYDAIHHSPSLPDVVEKMNKGELLAALEGLALSNNGKEAMQFKTLRTYKEDTLKRIYAAIKRCNNFIDVSSLTGDKIPENIDIMTYSFPCQDLSNVGAFHGYNKGIDKDSGSRSSLLWQVGRILQEMQDYNKKLPRFLLLENVPSLLAERHVDNFRTWIKDLEKLGYISKYFPLNALDFGLPQNRPRLLMISVFVGEDERKMAKVKKYFSHKDSSGVVKDYKNSKHYREKKIEEMLRTDYSNNKLHKEAIECTPNKTVSRDTIWENNPKIIKENGEYDTTIKFVRTITTKQDRHPNSGNLYFDSGIPGKSMFRYLTPRECFLFMGFTDEDYDRIIDNNPDVHKNNKLFPRDKLIRMAGNSIPVNLLEGIFYQVQKIDKLLNEE